MARTTKLTGNEFDFDDDFDNLDFNFDEPEQISDDRDPLTRVSTGILRGAKDTFTNPAFVKNTVRKTLPKEYGTVFDFAGETTGTIRDLYDTTSKELKPLVKDVRKFTKRITPLTEKVLPKSIQDKLQKFSEKDDYDQRRDEMDAREAAISSAIGEVFKVQMEKDHADRAEDKAEEELEKGATQKRHIEQMSSMDQIRLGVNQLAEYQKNVGSNFQRKTLELQYRQYFVSVDTLEETKKIQQSVTTNLEGILKNTGLPDFVKLKQSESFTEIARNKFISSLQDGLFENRDNFMRNFGKSITKTVKSKVSSFAQDMRAGMEMGASVLDMNDSMKEMTGSGVDVLEMGGGMVGSNLAERIGAKIPQTLQKVIDKYPAFGKWLVENGYDTAAKVSDPSKFFGNLLDRYNGPGAELLRDARADALRTNKSFEVDDLYSGSQAAVYNRRSEKALTEIIPGYLARMYRELRILRTGDDTQELTLYDYTTNKFDTESSVKKNVYNKIFDPADRQRVETQVDDALKEVEGYADLSEEKKGILRRHLLRSNVEGKTMDKDFLSDFMNYGGEAGYDGMEFADLFAKHFGEDGANSKIRSAKIKMATDNIGRGVADRRSVIQQLIGMGYGDMVDELGLANHGSYQIQAYHDELMNPKIGAQPGTSGNDQGMRGPGILPPPPAPAAPGAGPKPGPMPGAGPNQGPQNNATQQERYSGNAAGVVYKCDNQNVVDAIKEHSSRESNEQILKVLMSIAEMLTNGINTNGVGDNKPAAFAGKWYNAKLSQLPGMAWRKGKDTVTKTWERGKAAHAWGVGKVTNGFNWVKDKFTGGKDKLTEKWEIFVGNEVEPRLNAFKLKMERYALESDNTVIIRKLSDITGNVVDLDTGEVVLRYGDLKEAYQRNAEGAKKKLSDIVSKGWKGATNLFGKAAGVYGTAASYVGKALGWVGGKLNKLVFNKAQDVYVVGESEPRLLKIIMEAEGYRSLVSGKIIRTPADIDGPVVKSWDDRSVVLDTEALKKGICDVDGKPFKSTLKKIGSVIAGAAGLGVGLLKKGFDKVSGFLGGVWGSISQAFSNWFGERSSFSLGSRKTNDILTEILELLKERLPGGKVAGDVDGDGIRDGSIQDIRNKRDRAVATGTGVLDKAKLAGGGILAGVKGLFDKLTGKGKDKDKEAEEEEDDGFGLSDAADAAEILDFANGDGDGKEGRKGKGRGKRKWWQRNKGGKGKIPRGKAGLLSRGWDGLKNSRAVNWMGSKLGGGNLGVKAGGALAVGTAAYAAHDVYQNAKTNEDKVSGYSGAAGTLAGGIAGASAGGALGTAVLPGWGTAIGGFVGGIAGSILGETAVRNGVMGIYGLSGGYALDILGKVRFAQYGFLPTEEKDYWKKILKLENLAEGAVIFRNGSAGFDGNKLDIKTIAETLDVPINDPRAMQNLGTWLLQRFKPVFLTHRAILNSIKKDFPLSEVDDTGLTTVEKSTYLNQIRLANGPYGVVVSPFPGQTQLSAGSKEVADVYEMAKSALAAENAKGGKTFADSKTGKFLAKLGEYANPTNFALAKIKEGVTNVKNWFTDNGNKESVVGAIAAGKPVTVSIGGKDVVVPARVDALTMVRYKTYGLKDADPSKAQALAKLELAVMEDISYSADGVTWKGSPDKLIQSVGAAFGITTLESKAGVFWAKWLTGRFLPVFCTYLKALRAATGKEKLGAAETLNGNKRLEVAMAIYTTKGVWQVPFTPWLGYDLNMDIKSVDGNVQALRDAAKANNLLQETANKRDLGKSDAQTSSETGGLAGMAASLKNTASGAWKSMSEGASSIWKKATATANGWVDSASTAVSNAGAFVKDSANKAWTTIKETGGKVASAVGAGVDYVKNLPKAWEQRPLFKAIISEGLKAGLSVGSIAALLGNSAVENSFTNASENMNYSAKRLREVWPNRFGKMDDATIAQYVKNPEALANNVYSNRMGNGNEASGDGWRYRGRGVVQFTGKSMYAEMSQLLFGDNRLVENPDILNDPIVSARAGIVYLKKLANNTAQKLFGKDINSLAPTEAARALSNTVYGKVNADPAKMSPGHQKAYGEKLAYSAKYAAEMPKLTSGVIPAVAAAGGAAAVNAVDKPAEKPPAPPKVPIANQAVVPGTNSEPAPKVAGYLTGGTTEAKPTSERPARPVTATTPVAKPTSTVSTTAAPAVRNESLAVQQKVQTELGVTANSIEKTLASALLEHRQTNKTLLDIYELLKSGVKAATTAPATPVQQTPPKKVEPIPPAMVPMVKRYAG